MRKNLQLQSPALFNKYKTRGQDCIPRPQQRESGPRFKPNNYTSPKTTCEQKKEPSIPSLMHVGHWSFASSEHPEVWQTCVSIPAADIFVFIQEAVDYDPIAKFGNGDI